MSQSQKKTILDLVDSIDSCLQQKRILPCLILVYSGIEIIARMDSKPNEPTRSYFTRWVDRYILAKGHFTATALDLYAARCGVVHALSPDSDLYRDGKARRICYAWGNADVVALGDAISTLEADLVSIQLDKLVEAFRYGIAEFMDDLTNDEIARARAREVREEWFTELAPTVIEDFLHSHRDAELN